MRFLSEYISSLLLENHLMSDSVIGQIYINVFGEAAAKKRTSKRWRSTKAGRGQTCIIRAWFGDDDEEKLNNVKKFLVEGLDISLDDIELTMGFYPTVASGTYPACKIHALAEIKKDIQVGKDVAHIEINKGSDTYIICTGGSITKKQLTPAALGLSGKVFYNADDIISTLENSAKLAEKPTIKAFAISCLKKIIESTSGKKYKTVQELAESGLFSRDFSDLNFDNIDDKSYNNVLNDFGEIMGAAFILTKLEGTNNVYFPQASNSAIYDYVINYQSSVKQVNVSAKANGGAAPAATTPARGILELANVANSKSDLLDDKFFKHIIPVLARKYNGVDLDNAQSKIALLKVIANVFKDKQAIAILKLVNDYGVIIDDKTYSVDFDSIKHLKESGKLVEFLNKLNDLCRYGHKQVRSSFFSPEKVLSCLDGNNSKNIMTGCISQPFQRYAVDYLNKNYEDQITKFAHLSFGGYQIYLQKKRSKQLDIRIINMLGDYKYKLSVTGSINDPKNKNTAIEVIKH